MSAASNNPGDGGMGNLGTGAGGSDKGDDQKPTRNRPGRGTRKMKNVFRDMKAMSRELNRSLRSRGSDEVVEGTVEEMHHPNIGSSGPGVPATEEADDIVGTSTEAARDIVTSNPGVDVENRAGPSRRRTECSSQEEAVAAEAVDVYRDYYRRVVAYNENPSAAPTMLVVAHDPILLARFPGMGPIKPAKPRNEIEERRAKEQSRPRRWDKVRVKDFAEIAENKAAYHKAKAAEEAGPEGQPPSREPDLRHFDPSSEAQTSLRRSEERRRDEKRKSDERRSREQSGEEPPKWPTVRSLIPPDSPAPAGPVIPPGSQISRGPQGPAMFSAPAEPGTPSKDPAPVEPVEPVEPGASDEPGKPTEPVAEPVDPGASGEPVKPTDPVELVEPDASGEPGKPTETPENDEEGDRSGRKRKWCCL
ncbi:hypothetical protein VC83_03047 [Pseudogymnoascus destructans]|uniref:Uncharacterized protein n=2 Tax=Pseudogymnoascus destructans TaxID=655981 RepID=L8FUG8_PSED2|nr:uncharacterized protein VC83_03047 [Pseudogymnoascus destructans]ELR04174.1 hypothetical protein GMDG_06601 [Pseudogymnoascus destructans 20631-21]OAF59924.1 hypothetical protein VC83_03047 [Pseudogymnoascus destructans]